MKIKNIFATKEKVFSFEFFPPKTDKGEQSLYCAVQELKKLVPDFVSVTYGAFGTTQEKSLDIIKRICEDHALNVMAHYTCIGATEKKVDAFIESVTAMGVDNILALRGDPPQGMDITDALSESPFRHAVDLIRYIRANGHDVSIGVAGYPEVHPECDDSEQDLCYLKEKVDAGADFIVTQLFFDNRCFFDFNARAKKSGITVPIIPGIMPIENFKQIERMTSMCGAKVPDVLKIFFSRTDISDDEKRQFGLDYTIRQCQELLEANVKGLHFYTLNKSSATREIYSQLNPCQYDT